MRCIDCAWMEIGEPKHKPGVHWCSQFKVQRSIEVAVDHMDCATNNRTVKPVAIQQPPRKGYQEGTNTKAAREVYGL